MEQYSKKTAEDGTTPLLHHTRRQLADYHLCMSNPDRLREEIIPLLIELQDKPVAFKIYNDVQNWCKYDSADRQALSEFLRCRNRLPPPMPQQPYLEAAMCMKCSFEVVGYMNRSKICVVCRNRLFFPPTMGKKFIPQPGISDKPVSWGGVFKLWGSNTPTPKCFVNQAIYCNQHRVTPPLSVVAKCHWCKNILSANFSVPILTCYRCSMGPTKCFCIDGK